MSGGRKIALGAALMAAIGGTIGAIIIRKSHPVSIQGAVIANDTDPRKQSPIPDAEISVGDGLALGVFRSDPAGFFHLTFRRGVKRGEKVRLRFRHPDYQATELDELISDKLYIARMTPVHRERPPKAEGPPLLVTNVLVRYTLETPTDVNVGSGVKTFEVKNTANVPCNGQQPCSPDGKWKAAIGAAFLDAGEGNQFRNARVSCIAGPCPFTKIEVDGFSQGGPLIKVSVRNWSDTTTFLLEAEVFHREVSNTIQRTYPVILGQALNFTLPAAAQGPSLEAELDGTPIVFPLAENPFLSWAVCEARDGQDHSKTYRCELKPGYRFQGTGNRE